MPHRDKIISIRLDTETLSRLEIAAEQTTRPATLHPRRPYNSPYNRSEMIRHAINTGLDFLSHEPPLKL